MNLKFAVFLPALLLGLSCGYQTIKPTVQICPENQYFDTTMFRCNNCGPNAI